MAPNGAVRLSGLVLALGGIVNLAFLVVADGQITGAHTMMSGRWALAHNLHFYGAVLLLLGMTGLYAAHAGRLGRFGVVAFGVGVIGGSMFVGGGVVTAFLLPVIAAHAPDIVEASGALFDPPLPIVGISIVLFALGWLLMAVALWRSSAAARWVASTLAVGAVILGLPPKPFGPVPWAVVEVGGVLFAVATIALGVTLVGRSYAPAAGDSSGSRFVIPRASGKRA